MARLQDIALATVASLLVAGCGDTGAVDSDRPVRTDTEAQGDFRDEPPPSPADSLTVDATWNTDHCSEPDEWSDAPVDSPSPAESTSGLLAGVDFYGGVKSTTIDYTGLPAAGFGDSIYAAGAGMNLDFVETERVGACRYFETGEAAIVALTDDDERVRAYIVRNPVVRLPDLEGVGSSVDELLATLGEPLGRETLGGVDVWVYGDQLDDPAFDDDDGTRALLFAIEDDTVVEFQIGQAAFVAGVACT